MDQLKLNFDEESIINTAKLFIHIKNNELKELKKQIIIENQKLGPTFENQKLGPTFDTPESEIEKMIEILQERYETLKSKELIVPLYILIVYDLFDKKTFIKYSKQINDNKFNGTDVIVEIQSKYARRLCMMKHKENKKAADELFESVYNSLKKDYDLMSEVLKNVNLLHLEAEQEREDYERYSLLKLVKQIQ